MTPTTVHEHVRRLAPIAVVLLATVTLGAGMKVKTDRDKTVDFSTLRTWAWSDQGPGDVRMARTQEDDPEDLRQRAEPVILEAVATELSSRGLQLAVGSPPDLEVKYYLLITLGSSAQTIGQFVPTVPQWGLPPLSGATQSFRVVEQGSMVLDLSANDAVVWRGVAQAELKPGQDLEKRRALIREAIREMLKRYPRKR